MFEMCLRCNQYPANCGCAIPQLATFSCPREVCQPDQVCAHWYPGMGAPPSMTMSRQPINMPPWSPVACSTCGRHDGCRCYQRPVPANVYWKLKAEYDYIKSAYDNMLKLVSVVQAQQFTMQISDELAANIVPIGWRCSGCQKCYAPSVSLCWDCCNSKEG